MALLIQNHLRKVVLNMPNSSYHKNLHLVETSRWDYLRGQESPYELSSPSGARSDEGAEEGPKDDYTLSNAEDAKHYDRILLNDNWRIRPGVILIANKGLMVMTCRHHESYNTMKRLYPHPPRKPYHNLSSSFSDDLCHAKLVPRGATPVKAHKYNSSFSMQTQQASFSGVDSCNVCTGSGSFRNPSVLLKEHAALSIARRPDISQLAERLVTEGAMTADLAESIRDEAERRYGISSPHSGELLRCCEGSTYTNVEDSMILHLNPPQSTISAIVGRKSRTTNE